MFPDLLPKDKATTIFKSPRYRHIADKAGNELRLFMLQIPREFRFTCSNNKGIDGVSGLLPSFVCRNLYPMGFV